MQEVRLGQQRRYAGPLYAQIYDELRGRIVSRDWPPGWAFPNETDLARSFGVSVGTMRKALGLLENEQLICRQRGRGTFVSEPSRTDPWPICLQLHLRSKGPQLTCRKFTWECGRASAEETSHLRLGESDSVVRVLREHCSGNDIVALERIVVPAMRLPDLDQQDLSAVSLFGVYRQHYGVMVKRLTEEVFSSNADEFLRRTRGQESPEFILSKNRLAFDGNDRGVEWSLLQVLVPDALFVLSRSHAPNRQSIVA